MQKETLLIQIKNEWHLIVINPKESTATLWLIWLLNNLIVWQHYYLALCQEIRKLKWVDQKMNIACILQQPTTRSAIIYGFIID